MAMAEKASNKKAKVAKKFLRMYLSRRDSMGPKIGI
jgi:hypothetical protein